MLVIKVDTIYQLQKLKLTNTCSFSRVAVTGMIFLSISPILHIYKFVHTSSKQIIH